MAVVAGIYGKSSPEYVGGVMDTYEHNGRDDSDWYAVCWDEEQQKVVHVNYDTTRCGGGGRADIDITEENLLKVYRYYKQDARKWFDTVGNPESAKQVRKGDTVRVVKGRKVKKGTEGTVAWIGSVYNKFSYCVEERVGIDIGDQRVFVPMDYVEVVGWEQRLVRGKERKQKIRNAAVNSLPVQWRHLFS